PTKAAAGRSGCSPSSSCPSRAWASPAGSRGGGRPMAARRTLSPRGFSLLEVLVSVTLFAIICSVLYSGFSMVTRSWRRGHENIQQSERLRSVFELIRRQVISIYPVVPVEEDTEADLAQPGPQRMIAAKIPYFVGSDQQVAFVTLFSLRLN